ncbi:hypothetical protein ACW95P_04095 [Candidatus Mycoplasma pogonae]
MEQLWSNKFSISDFIKTYKDEIKALESKINSNLTPYNEYIDQDKQNLQ